MFDWQFDYLGKSALKRFGGINGLVEALHSNKEKGLTTEEAEDEERIDTYGINYQAPKKMVTFLELVWNEWKMPTMIVLTVAGLLSLVLGLINDTEGTGWVEGCSILLAVMICIFVAALNELSERKEVP